MFLLSAGTGFEAHYEIGRLIGFTIAMLCMLLAPTLGVICMVRAIKRPCPRNFVVMALAFAPAALLWSINVCAGVMVLRSETGWLGGSVPQELSTESSDPRSVSVGDFRVTVPGGWQEEMREREVDTTLVTLVGLQPHRCLHLAAEGGGAAESDFREVTRDAFILAEEFLSEIKRGQVSYSKLRGRDLSLYRIHGMTHGTGKPFAATAIVAAVRGKDEVLYLLYSAPLEDEKLFEKEFQSLLASVAEAEANSDAVVPTRL